MRISGKGVIVILLFLVVIPVIIDLILVSTLSKNGETFAMSRLLSSGYLKALPFYIGYVIIVFTIVYLIKKWKKSQIRQDE